VIIQQPEQKMTNGRPAQITRKNKQTSS